jgi:hypothetical protein
MTATESMELTLKIGRGVRLPLHGFFGHVYVVFSKICM